MEEFTKQQSFWKGLTKQQKWGMGFLIFFILIILLFWFIQLKKSLFYPMYGGLSAREFQEKMQEYAMNNSISDDQKIELYQKNADTDKDGISDWEENNIYHTSPYLADSDGDGISDKQEIALGQDPNCPQGKDCSLTIESNNINNPKATINNNFTKNNSSTGVNKNVPSELNKISADNSAAIMKQVFGENPTADDIRNLLKSSGIDAKELDKISDEELLQTYNKLAK